MFKALIAIIFGLCLPLRGAPARAMPSSKYLARLKAQGFQSPCHLASYSRPEQYESVTLLLNGPDDAWTLAEYSCTEDNDIRGLWFKSRQAKAFRQVAEIGRSLTVSASPDRLWLFLGVGPGSGESYAGLLPVSAFSSTERVARWARPGVTYLDLDSRAYVDLEKLYLPKIPKSFDGRRGIGTVAWKNPARISFQVRARNGNEDHEWQGNFEYDTKSRTLILVSSQKLR